MSHPTWVRGLKPALGNSSTPNTSYILLNKYGKIKCYRVYDYSRRPIIDIDFDSHKGISPHIHFFKGNRENNIRALNKIDRKKYRKILEAAGV